MNKLFVLAWHDLTNTGNVLPWHLSLLTNTSISLFEKLCWFLPLVIYTILLPYSTIHQVIDNIISLTCAQFRIMHLMTKLISLRIDWPKSLNIVMCYLIGWRILQIVFLRYSCDVLRVVLWGNIWHILGLS